MRLPSLGLWLGLDQIAFGGAVAAIIFRRTRLTFEGNLLIARLAQITAHLAVSVGKSLNMLIIHFVGSFASLANRDQRAEIYAMFEVQTMAFSWAHIAAGLLHIPAVPAIFPGVGRRPLSARCCRQPQWIARLAP